MPDLDPGTLSVVRTVGDLTLRQLRARPQIRLRVGDEVGTLYAGGSLKLITHDGRGLVVPVTLDTPCEVLP